MKRMTYVAALCVALAGCALPASNVTSGSTRPTLRLSGAPQGSELILDGQPVGPADRYDGSKEVLAVEEGVHWVEVRQGSTAILTKRIFAASGEAVNVDVSVGTQP